MKAPANHYKVGVLIDADTFYEVTSRGIPTREDVVESLRAIVARIDQAIAAERAAPPSTEER